MHSRARKEAEGSDFAPFKADIFALGKVLCSMVFGLQRTLDISTNFGVSEPVEFIPGTEVPADFQGMPELSTELREVLIGCLQKDEQQGWGDHQLHQCSWLRSGSCGAGAEAEGSCIAARFSEWMLNCLNLSTNKLSECMLKK